MADPDNWEYNCTLTIRLREDTKRRLLQEAEARGDVFSDYVRDKLVRGVLPEELLSLIPPDCRIRVEKLAGRLNQDPGEVLVKMLFREAIPYLLDHVSHGV